MKVNKSVLIAMGAALWGYAAFKILKIGVTTIEMDQFNRITYYLLGVAGFIPFFYFVFLKVSKRYFNRIVDLPDSKHYPHQFMNLRGYIMVTFMITLGILSAKLDVWNPVYKGIFYISLGLSLLSASIVYVVLGVKFNLKK